MPALRPRARAIEEQRYQSHGPGAHPTRNDVDRLPDGKTWVSRATTRRLTRTD